MVAEDKTTEEMVAETEETTTEKEKKDQSKCVSL